ncbi:TipC family immunity protein [Enterococcus plantarum]|uniref:TipC family immunity protein n=2 Tax=Enterococcus TaxID=1350 RepID=UPI001A8FEEEC|nr:TipC family immunity protein [Enterococcus plantarum]MBO0423987.1 TipC family immunity protein [Enterococcus plantarum]
MKKRLIIVFILLITIWVGYKSLEYLKIKNVFDEMYYTEIKDMKKQTANGFPKMKQIKSWNRKSVQTFDELTIIQERYKDELLNQGESISFYFDDTEKLLSFGYIKQIDNDVFLQIDYGYRPKGKKLVESVGIVLADEKEVDPKSIKEIQKYLDKYQISKEFLRNKSNEILYNTVIKDWVESYDSSFTVKNIGEVNIEKDEFFK